MSELLKNNQETIGSDNGTNWQEVMKDAPAFNGGRVDNIEKARAMANVENSYHNKATHIAKLAKEDRENGNTLNAETMEQWAKDTLAEGNAAAEKEEKFYDKFGHGSEDPTTHPNQTAKEMEDEEYTDLVAKVKPEDILSGDYQPGAGYN